MVGDSRRMRVYRIVGRDSMVTREFGTECWQEPDGKLCCVGLWADLVFPYLDDLIKQAEAKNISPLEWLKRKLEACSFIAVEVI